MITINNFKDKYKNKGGIKVLSMMRENCETLASIAYHFGVSKERICQWMEELFDEKYDPRKRRREAKIAMIMKLIKKLGIEDVKKMHFNKNYLKKAIKNLKK